MIKLVYAICEQQRHRSACASMQSDQRLCCSLPASYNTSTCYSRNSKTLASLISRAGWFESFLVADPEDRFLVTYGSYGKTIIFNYSNFFPSVQIFQNFMVLIFDIQVKRVLITYMNTKGSGEYAHHCSLAITFAVR